MNIVVRQEPAELPGDPFTLKAIDRDVSWFIAETDKPVGQVALIRRGNIWWLDYLYIREDARGQGILAALLKIIFPTTAQTLDYLWVNCVGVRPEDLQRHRVRHGPPGVHCFDVINTGYTKEKPTTLARAHVYVLRQQKEISHARSNHDISKLPNSS